MAASTHSHAVTDPFSAIYKARPGQLPSSLSIESYQHPEQGNQIPDPPLHSISSRQSEKPAHYPSKPAENVFCPFLAGERDRVVRKRMLSNPESLLPSPSIVTPTNPSSKPSTSARAGIGEGGKSTNQHQFRTAPFQANPIDPCSYNPPRRGGIFFSPPRNVDALTVKRIRSENRTSSTHHRTEDEAECTLRLDSHRRFSSAFSLAITRGDTCVDLDNQGLYTIPDLSQLVEEQKRAIGHLQDKAKVMALIEKMVDPADTSHGGASRQPITRASSAPVVSFSPRTTTSLFLSNNYLASTLFANLPQICYFQGLEHLSLRSNRLTEIPPEIGNLKHLKVLNLAHNLLEFLPASILKLTQCKLFLNGNPWLKPPATPPLGASSSLNTATARPARRFRWLSQSRGVFYFSSAARTLVPLEDPLQPPIPSLLETCIRKMCISEHMNGEEETIIGHDEGPHLQHDMRPASPSGDETRVGLPSSAEAAVLLPARVQEILADPAAHFYRCDLCRTRLVLKPGALVDRPSPQNPLSPQYAFQFRSLDGLVCPPSPRPHTETQKISFDQNLVPIRWNICSLNCCVNHLINT